MVYIQGRNEGEQGGRNSPGDASLRGAKSVQGVPNGCRGAEKSLQCNKYLLQYNAFASYKDLKFEYGGAKLVSYPGHHLTSLRPCLYVYKIVLI